MGMGLSSQDLADALLIIFKTNSSATGSKVSNGFPGYQGKQLGLEEKNWVASDHTAKGAMNQPSLGDGKF